DGSDTESGPVKEGIANFRTAMDKAGARTCGEFLAQRHRDRLPVRSRNVSDKITKAAYDFYPARELVEEEFDLLWASQTGYHSELDDAARDAIKNVFFRQRPLRAVQPGKCTLNPEEDRAPWALPLAQKFRILQDIGNLTIARPGTKERKVTLAERDILLGKLLGAKEPTFKALRKALKLAPDEYFNLENDRRTTLKGDQTAAVLAAEPTKKNAGRWGKVWRDLPFECQQQNAEMLLAEEDEERLVGWLMDECGLDRERAESVSAAPLPQGYARLGPTALTGIVDAFMNDSSETSDPDTGEVYDAPLTYDAACEAAGYHHSDLDRLGEDDLLTRLPYYGDVLTRHVVENHDAPEGSQEKRGRITNPTVHIGLNQLRKVINAIIGKYGAPNEIVVELARDLKMGKKQKDELSKQQAQNQKANEARAVKMAEVGIIDPAGQDFLKMRLWEELDPEDAANRRCPYTGKQISLQKLFSPAVEMEHILPFRRTLDNSPANKTVSMRAANREKGNRSPHEAFGDSPAGYDWEDIRTRAGCLPANKKWRFQPDAMERFDNEEKGFLDRQLVDTRYLSRISTAYLRLVCPAVWVIPGRLTAMLRGKWGLNSLLRDHNIAGAAPAKDRTDHRHHAIDAFVIACTSRGMLKRVADAADQNRQLLIEKMPDPFSGYDRDDLHRIIGGIVVSHRPD
ncbi:MAG: type II CRISPR RNA-guided endonuclease Cas9, partial [Proteobacteria bacterium]|nr:type II CRISPR RNA-guided endonuclease Cas9 [Pseudomonadota bacterium]